MRFFTALILMVTTFSSASSAQQYSWAERLVTAISLEDIYQVKSVLEQGDNLNLQLADGRSPIVIAAVQSSAEILQIMVNGGVDPDVTDDEGYSAIMRALQFGRVENAKLLHSLGASLEGITRDGQTVRLLAENVGLKNFGPAHPPSLKSKMSEEEANQILLYAAEAGDLETVKFALDNGASVHAKANNGWTAAMLAGLGGHAVVLKTLVLNDALQSNGIYHATDNVDLIISILVGEGGNAPKLWDNVDEMLHFVVDHKDVKKTRILVARGVQYRAIAEKLDYPLFILDIFPELYNPLPRIESIIPTGIPATKKNWKRVQEILKANGLYKGAIDGDAGRGTLGALLAYYRPLANLVKSRSVEAAEAATRDGKTDALRGSNISAVCRKKAVETQGKKYNFCGEFKADRSSGVFGAEFAGYTLSEIDNDRNIYSYITGNADFSRATRRIYVIEKYSRSNDEYSNIHVSATILDDVFNIEIYNKKIVYYLSKNPKNRRSIVGSFARPEKPNGY